MSVAEPGLEPADQRFVDQERIEVHRHLGDPDPLTLGRDAGMQVGQGLLIREPFGLRHETLDELQHPVGAIDETLENLVSVAAPAAGAALVEPRLRRGPPPRPAAERGR